MGYVAYDPFAKSPIVGANLSVCRGEVEGAQLDPTPKQTCEENNMVWAFGKCMSRAQFDKSTGEIGVGMIAVMITTGITSIFIAGYMKEMIKKRRRK